MRSQTQQRQRRASATPIDSGEKKPARLDPIAFGTALGTMMATFVGAVGLLSRFGWGEQWRTLFADAYPGFEADDGGTLVGIAWGAIDGFLAGLVTAWLYNIVRRQ